MVKRQRMDNIDLLRCISMIFIVSCHYFGNISKVADFELNTFSDISFKLISCIDNVGVNIFALSCIIDYIRTIIFKYSFDKLPCFKWLNEYVQPKIDKIFEINV